MNCIIHSHTGLGDHIICNGLVHKYTEFFDIVYVLHTTKYSESVRALYKDFTNIHTIEADDYVGIHTNEKDLTNLIKVSKQLNSKILCISGPKLQKKTLLHWESKDTLRNIIVHPNFERQFYDLAFLDYKCRYLNSKIPTSTLSSKNLYNKLSQGKDYVLIHDNTSENNSYPINTTFIENKNLPIIRIKEGLTSNIFDYYDLIVKAKEIHVIASSFYCLVDNIITPEDTPLYFHNIRASYDSVVNNPWNKYKWNILEYVYKQ